MSENHSQTHTWMAEIRCFRLIHEAPQAPILECAENSINSGAPAIVVYLNLTY